MAVKLYTADDLLAMGPDARCELHRGVLVPMSPTGASQGRITANAQFAIESYVRRHALGRVSAAETGFKLARSPDVVRAPDVAFVRAERLPAEDDRYPDLAPDLVVVVVSSGDAAHEIEQKVADHLGAGTQPVWVIYPRTETVMIHRAHGVRRLRAADAVDPEPALPGFRCALADLFA